MENRICPYCGSAIDSKNKSKKFCSNSHRVMYFAKEKNKRLAANPAIPKNCHVVTEIEKLTLDRLNVICGGKMSVMSALDLFAQFLKNHQNVTSGTSTDEN